MKSQIKKLFVQMASGNGGACQGGNKLAYADAVTGVKDDGKMAKGL